MIEPCPYCCEPACILEITGAHVTSVGCQQAYLKPAAGEKVCEMHPTVFSDVGRDDAIEQWNAWCQARKGGVKS